MGESPSAWTGRVFRSTSVIFVLSGAGTAVAMGVQIFIAALAGLSAESDAFFVAYTIPVFFATLFTSSKQVLVAAFSQVRETGTAVDAQRFYNVVMSVGVLIAGVIGLLDYLLAPAIVRVLAPGADPETRSLAVQFVRIVGWIPLFLGLGLICGAILNAYERFAVDAGNNLVRFSIPILFGLLFRGMGVRAIAIGLLVGAVVQALSVLAAAYIQVGYRYRPNLDYRHAGLGQMGRLVWVAVQGTMLRQVMPISTRLVASYLPTGTIALVQYGSRLTGPVSTVFFGSVVTATMPSLAASVVRGIREDVQRIVRLSWRLIGLISLPLVALMVGLNRPLVSLLFGWTSSGVALVESIVPLSLVYNLSLLFFGYVALQNAYFYATDSRKRVLQVVGLLAGVDLVVKLVLVPFVGPLAFAISFSLAYLVAVAVGARYVAGGEGLSVTRLLPLRWALMVCAGGIAAGSFAVARVVSAVRAPGVVTDLLAILAGCVVASVVMAAYILYLCRGDLKRVQRYLRLGNDVAASV